MMKHDDFKLLRGYADGHMNEQTDICDCRVTFATENVGSNTYTHICKYHVYELIEFTCSLNFVIQLTIKLDPTLELVLLNFKCFLVFLT